MIAVIFRATVRGYSAAYAESASQLRELAVRDYGCLEFVSAIEGNNEIAISYWPDMAHVAAWRQDLLQQAAQERGRDEWYSEFRVQVGEIFRGYVG